MQRFHDAEPSQHHGRMKTHPLHLVFADANSHDAELAQRELASLPLANSVIKLTDGEAVLDFFLGPAGTGGRAAVHAPCLLFLDLGLPKLDGLTVLDCLKRHPLTRTLPVVILTGSSEDHLHAKSLEIGADSFLLKPLTREKLVGLVFNLGFFWEIAAPATLRPRRHPPALRAGAVPLARA